MTAKMYAAAALLAGLWAGYAQAALVISTAPTANVTCGGTVCSATAQDAVLNAHDLERWLAHRDTRVVSGSIAVDIEIGAPLHWTSTHRLTFDAYRSIAFTQPVISAGTGGLTITTDDGGTGGDFVFTGKGRAVFWDLGSSLIVNGMSYTLVADIATLASDIAANRYGNYALANDDRETSAYIASPVSNDFYGTFEGLGNWIVGLQIDDPNPYGNFTNGYVGMFATPLGILRDINLKAAVSGVVGGQAYVGILAAFNGGTILHCAAYGSVKGGIIVGGLVGWNGFKVLDSHATVSVNGDGAYEAGGLAGRHGLVYGPPPPPDPSLIADSYANGNVTSGTNTTAGGLAGNANYAAILRSHATGIVHTGDNAFAGGLVAYSQGLVDSSWASGAVAAGDGSHAGGLAGGMGQSRYQRGLGYLTNSYATGPVTVGNNGYAGGLAGTIGGLNRRHVERSYSVGTVSAGAGGYVGGLAGADSVGGFAYQTYWDLDTSGVSDPSKGAGNMPNDPGITGLTTAQLQSGLPAGFDPTIWGESPGINNGLPYLLALPPQ